ncbi:DEAD/DEAH box helicase [Occultella gossypii]|uniref:DEAD/DEAH box helicase n=1 Tax=Occultella gossypii TaxID=2800820 RepID=A0ABS7S4Z4_9MICO|nr:DEAD/DEAH box helicase [Occultella gossypii]MBZ2195404.1 DEAD/DEAH box helicase [Occultella gossypii]
MSVESGLNAAVEYHVVNSLGWSSLRPLQHAAVAPVRAGKDCLLIAPTAGGKTEAALFPLLSEMVEEDWHGLSVLYITPLRALLNNLYPRLEQYAGWLGRRVALWHGDVGDSERRRILGERPDMLLTTPESLESMLVSRRVDHRALFAGVRAVVIDEVHAFAGADRGWHLLAVLERIQRLAGRRIQRVGLSATVGNPESILTWLRGSNVSAGTGAEVVTGEDHRTVTSPVDVTLDYVGSLANAAEVISRLYRGEKRLVFCESRRRAEELAFELRARNVTTFVSHSSLSRDERQVSERAFAEARDCVIVATSTLELGVDIGDLDRMIQIDAPRSVASFLQRLGRTGRRAGTQRNALFLAVESEGFLRAAALLLLWGQGLVEPVVPPPSPRHLAAQQLLALALQEGRFGATTWRSWWDGLGFMDEAAPILEYLRSEQFLVEDQGMVFIGPRAEKEFGRRYFMDLLASFSADLELRVVAGVREIGMVSPLALQSWKSGGPAKRLLLAGWAWRVESVDWERREVVVSDAPDKGKVRWPSEAVAESFELARAQRDVLLGRTPDVVLSRRAVERLARIRDEMADVVDPDGLVVLEAPAGREFWTWAGLRANETLIAALGAGDGADNHRFTLDEATGLSDLRAAPVDVALPVISPQAVDGLKFSAALAPELATATLAERFVDRSGAMETIQSPIVATSISSRRGQLRRLGEEL